MKKYSNKKIGVALSGGSALGTSHIGSMQALMDHNIKISSIAGTSAGSIVAACFAFGIPLEDITKKATELGWTSISKFAFSKLGIVSNDRLGDIVRDFFGDVKLESSPIPLSIVATDIKTGGKFVFREGSLVDAIKANCCIPGFFTPVEIGGRKFVDGGLVENLPLSELHDVDIKLGFNVNRKVSQKDPQNILDVVGKSMEILTDYNIKPLPNEILIEPNLSKFTPSDFAKAREIAAEGYRATILKLPEILMAISAEPLPSPSLLKRIWNAILNK